jgi:hypothetical protein
MVKFHIVRFAGAALCGSNVCVVVRSELREYFERTLPRLELS